MKLYKVEAQSTKCPPHVDRDILAVGFRWRSSAEKFLIGLAESGQAKSGEITSYDEEDEEDEEDEGR
jgi:hypothetical protein